LEGKCYICSSVIGVADRLTERHTESLLGEALRLLNLTGFLFSKVMDFLERDLEDIIFNELQSSDGYDNLNERGLDICFSKGSFICKRQLRIGNYGICDMVTLSRFKTIISDKGTLIQAPLYIEVIELKKGEINSETLFQAIRYLTGIKIYMEDNYPSLVVDYSITLIGRTINTGDWIYLIDQLHNLKVQTYSYEIDGITFKTHRGYCLKNSGLTICKDPF